MVKNTIRCGNSNGEYREEPRLSDGRPVPFTPKRTPIHFASPPSAMREYRVVARLKDGSIALVCAGDTRQEAVALAGAAWKRTIPGAEGLFLERWTFGGWSGLKVAKGELPEPLRFRRRLGKKEARRAV